MSLVQIKDFNAFIDNKTIFRSTKKYKQEAYEKLVEISINDYYAKGNLLDYLSHQNYYILIGIHK